VDKLPRELPGKPCCSGKACAVAGAELPDAIATQGTDRLLQLLRGGETQVSTADQGMDLRNPRPFPGKLNGVDEPGMAATEEEDKSPAAGNDQ